MRIFVFILFLIFSPALLSADDAANTAITIDLTLPKIEAHPYHKPYVAVWLEDENRKPLAGLALWAKEDTWYKDLRQWWRKLGRNNPAAYDAVSGATRLPGKHSIEWNGVLANGEKVKPGIYLLNIEASREEGGRSYVRKEISIGAPQKHQHAAEGELGEITITLN